MTYCFWWVDPRFGSSVTLISRAVASFRKEQPLAVNKMDYSSPDTSEFLAAGVISCEEDEVDEVSGMSAGLCLAQGKWLAQSGVPCALGAWTKRKHPALPQMFW